jgi:hypothetical protein
METYHLLDWKNVKEHIGDRLKQSYQGCGKLKMSKKRNLAGKHKEMSEEIRNVSKCYKGGTFGTQA